MPRPEHGRSRSHAKPSIRLDGQRPRITACGEKNSRGGLVGKNRVREDPCRGAGSSTLESRFAMGLGYYFDRGGGEAKPLT